jgi:hypothetical protein
MDISLLIDKYLSDKNELMTENDSFNIVNGSIFRWDFANIPCPSQEELDILSSQIQEDSVQEKINADALAFLAATDWKCRRHEDQKLMGKTPSLSDKEFIELLIARQEARERIK